MEQFKEEKKARSQKEKIYKKRKAQ